MQVGLLAVRQVKIRPQAQKSGECCHYGERTYVGPVMFPRPARNHMSAIQQRLSMTALALYSEADEKSLHIVIV